MRTGTICALLFATVTSTVGAADIFEGRIHIEFSEGGRRTTPLDYTLKDGKIRVELPSDRPNGGPPPGAMIMDLPHNEMILFMWVSGQRKIMRLPLTPPKRAPSAKSAAPAEPAPVATSRTTIIAGYSATEYQIAEEKGQSTELWLAQGLGTFLFPMMPEPISRASSDDNVPSWMRIARERRAFPLRVITRDDDGDGREKFHFEVTKIEPSPVSAALFSTAGNEEYKSRVKAWPDRIQGNIERRCCLMMRLISEPRRADRELNR